jgi:serine/threonine protein kinase
MTVLLKTKRADAFLIRWNVRYFSGISERSFGAGITMSLEADDTTRINRPMLDFSYLEPSTEPGTIGKVGGFHLQEELGHGGMGVVFKAWDESLRRVVAVKFIRQDRTLSANAKDRFIREARAAAAVSHPHIVVVHRIDEIKGTPYIVMEYVDGSSLERQISKGKRFPALELMQLILQITEGLQAAHECGIIHRDIKPSNILVESGSGRSKISDFGLARIDNEVSADSESGTVVGTPAYMSPEQINGETVDTRSDLFSLGCLIHALVTGESPFQGKSFADTASRILTTTPRPLSAENPSVPVVLSSICSKLLEKKPSDRYQTAKEVSRDIREIIFNIQRGVDVPMADTIVVESPAAKRRTRLKQAGLGAVGSLFLTLIGISLLVNRQWSRPLESHTQQLISDVPKFIRVLTVSKEDANSDFRTVAEALKDVQPGDTIRVTDDGEYKENLLIQGKQDITIESPQGAHLIQSDLAQPGVRILDCQRVVVRGFQISCGDHHAVLVSESTGVRLEDLNIVARPRETAAVQIDNCNSSQSDPPLIVSGCRIESQGTGQCLWVQAIGPSIWNLQLSSNSFFAQGTATVAVLALLGGKVSLDHNIFDGGHVGINMELKRLPPNASKLDLKIRHNTFHRLRSWIGLLGSDPAANPFELSENLILNCEGVEANSDQQNAVASVCIVGGNVWEHPNRFEAETDAMQRWASYQSQIDVTSRERDTNGFLTLPDNSPLRDTGAEKKQTPPGALP